MARPAVSGSVAALAARDLASAADVAVALRGEPVARERLGAGPGARFLLFSLSKTIAAVTMLALADTGAIELEAPVARYVPAFAAHGKEVVTVEDVLCHRGGFSELSSGAPLEIDDFADADRARAAICALPFDRALHGVAVYHPLSYSILADVVAAAAAEPFAAACARLVLEPLGMAETTWGLPPAVRALGVPLTGPETAAWAGRALLDGVIAAGNAFSSADDVLRLFAMLRAGGGTVLREETVAAMVAPRVPARGQAGARAFGYGVFVGSEPGTLSGRGASASERCFGHAGFTATQAWHDPDGDLTAVALTNSCVGQEESDARFQDWSDELRRRLLAAA